MATYAAAVAAAVSAAASMAGAQQQRKYQKKKTNLQMEQQKAQLEQAEREENKKERRQRAQAIAHFGAAGIGGTGGSADAVTRGIREESQQRMADMRENSYFGARGLLLEDKANASAYKFGQIQRGANGFSSVYSKLPE